MSCSIFYADVPRNQNQLVNKIHMFVLKILKILKPVFSVQTQFFFFIIDIHFTVIYLCVILSFVFNSFVLPY